MVIVDHVFTKCGFKVEQILAILHWAPRSVLIDELFLATLALNFLKNSESVPIACTTLNYEGSSIVIFSRQPFSKKQASHILTKHSLQHSSCPSYIRLDSHTLWAFCSHECCDSCLNRRFKSNNLLIQKYCLYLSMADRMVMIYFSYIIERASDFPSTYWNRLWVCFLHQHSPYSWRITLYHKIRSKLGILITRGDIKDCLSCSKECFDFSS